METGERDDLCGRLALTAAFAEVPDPRVVGRSKYDLVEMLVISVCAMVCGIEDFVGIESWSKERIDWLRRFLTLENGIPSHDTLGRLFGLLDRRAVEKSFRAWVGSVLPALAAGQVVAIDGKASRRSRKKGLQPLHLVSAFATEARLILGQEACAEKSNELTAIPVLLETLMLKGVIVTIDAMGTHSNIAQAIRDKAADYVLAVKDNQPSWPTRSLISSKSVKPPDGRTRRTVSSNRSRRIMAASKSDAAGPSHNWTVWLSRSNGLT